MCSTLQLFLHVALHLYFTFQKIFDLMAAVTFQPSSILDGFNWPPYNTGMFQELHIEDQHLVARHLEEKASRQISSVRDSDMCDYDKQVNLQNLEKLARMHHEAECCICPLVAAHQAREEMEYLRHETWARQEVSDAVKALKVATEKRKKVRLMEISS